MADDAPPPPPGGDPAAPAAPRLIYRHRASTRAWHWLNTVALTIMLMSGLMIFNAHPRLYWGEKGYSADAAWLQIGPTPTGGHLVVGPIEVPTTGVLGRWKDRHGIERTRAFPWWATIPSDYSLAAARRWHLSFAWVFALATIGYLVTGLVNRHFARDLWPSRAELAPRHLWRDIKDHARLRLPTGEAATRYNILQKLAYGGVLFLALPLAILTGMAMSPWLDANFPWLLAGLGGRQSARSIHFLCAASLTAFVAVHLAMVVLAGPVREVRAIVTGWFAVPEARARKGRAA